MSAAPTTYANHLAMHRALDAAPVLDAAGLGAIELLVLTVIARHLGHGDNGNCWVSQETIAKEALCERRTALRAIERLKDANVVSVIKRPGRSSVLAVNLDLSLSVTRHSLSHVTESDNTCHSESHPPVTQSDTGVTPSDNTCHSERHEVVKQVDQLSRSGEVDQQSDPASASGERPARLMTSSSGTEGKATAKTEPVPPSAKFASTQPERRLADRYWELLGSPAHQAVKLAVVWPDIFERLLADHSYDDLLDSMEWAFGSSESWPGYLHRHRGCADSVEYFAAKLPDILSQHLGDKRAKENAAKKTSATPRDSAPQPYDINNLCNFTPLS